MLPHLSSGWEVDQAIVTEEDRVVMIRFGRDQDPTCMVQDEVLANIAEKVKNFAVIYLVDIDEVPDFNGMYEIFDACTTMFFYRNKHIMVDLGTGDNNKINWAMTDKQELIDIIEIVYRFVVCMCLCLCHCVAALNISENRIRENFVFVEMCRVL